VAVVNFLVSNPTNVDITTNAKTALANAVTQLSFDDAALANGFTDIVVFLNGGCLVAKSSISTENMEEGGRLFGEGHGAVIGH